MIAPPPNAVEASRFVALAKPYHDARDFAAAEDAYRAALQADPSCTDAMHGLAQLVQHLDRGDEVVRWMELALALKPRVPAYHYTLGVGQSMILDTDGACASFRRAADMGGRDGLPAFQNLIFTSDLHQATTPEYALALRREFNARYCAYQTANALPHRNRPDPDKRLRIGFVGADFRGHSAAIAHKPIVLGLDRERFEVYLYNNGTTRDGESEHYAEAANWRDIHDLDPGSQAQEIADDRIDVLIDVAGFTAGAALQAFALKPAPVQVSAWGYITGTGLDCMDYLFADPVLAPPEHDGYYAESVVRLPAPYPYTPATLPEIRDPAPHVRNGHVTFGYFGRPNKISPACLDAWGEILRAVPDARLVLKAGTYDQATPARKIMNGLLARGVAAERITLLSATDRPHHLAAHNEIDVALDPFPQTGGMTSCDAFLMGVPVVTLLGRRSPERTTAAIWAACRRWDGVAEDVEHYVRLAADPAGVSGWNHLHRRHLRAAFLTSTMVQTDRYVRAVEEALLGCWREWCEKTRVEREGPKATAVVETEIAPATMAAEEAA